LHILISSLLSFVMLTMSLCAWYDRRRKRAKAAPCTITVIVPCYNDADTVGDTLRSIFAAWPAHLLDVVAINDASRDDSLARIREVAEAYPVTIIDNEANCGKSESLNRAIAAARHEIILCLDADTLLTAKALQDMLDRLAHDPRIGAVSCPYSPINRGFLSAMQAIEYSMLRLTQGAGNVTSALALWGGCLMLRRDAFNAVGVFSHHALTEDVDLAFKLNRAGWRVEQSFVFVQTHVPTTWKTWLKQKTRWTSGGFQCTFAYPDVWLRNPLQVLFISVYAAMAMLCVFAPTDENSLLQIGRDISGLIRLDIPLNAVFDLAILKHGTDLLVGLLASVTLNLLSLIYVIPTISRMQDWLRIALVLPFSLGYFPIYVIVAAAGLFFWFTTLRRTPEGQRAW
jgi:cellulose synthase/poly-beta-1,6-N-acetylglucosamine synthase-like glycosyltransferase